MPKSIEVREVGTISAKAAKSFFVQEEIVLGQWEQAEFDQGNNEVAGLCSLQWEAGV
jgi:hypothetical protein